MPFYLRKSLSFGPIRFNLSKSGVGVSAGIRGFRVGSGPRGNYVHMGRGGLYYRASLPAVADHPKHPAIAPPVPPPEHPPGAAVRMVEVDSASAGQIVDSSSRALVDELRTKRKLMGYSTLALAGGGMLGTLHIANQWPPVAGMAVVAVTIIAFVLLRTWDMNRKTTVIFYDLDSEAESVYRGVYTAFEGLSRCQRLWHIPSRGAVHDRKYHGGAGELISRNPSAVRFDNPPYIRTNVPTPSLGVGTQTLYFFPDKVLVYDRSDIGGVSFDGLSAEISVIQFIETDPVPSDSKVVGQTWRYVNKKGGPDRRFKDNREIPIVQYEQVHLRSRSGLNELLHVSQPGRFQKVMDAVRAIGSLVRE